MVEATCTRAPAASPPFALCAGALAERACLDFSSAARPLASTRGSSPTSSACRVDAGLALAPVAGVRRRVPPAGWEVTEVEPADEHADGVFVEDTVVVFGDLAVLTRPGADVAARGGRVDAARPLELAGMPVAAIEPPGTLDGGDVLKVGRDRVRRADDRTDDEGIAQLRALLDPRGGPSSRCR